MKIKLAFVAIAMFAIASAFAGKAKFLAHKYQYLGTATISGVAYYRVAATDLTTKVEGPLPGQYQCLNTGNCAVNTDNTAQIIAGNPDQYVPQAGANIQNGSFVQH